MADKTWNKNVRFNMNSEDAVQAWSLLHSAEVDREFKSQNEFIICAINDFYERHISTKNDPYLETREKEDAFVKGIVFLISSSDCSLLVYRRLTDFCPPATLLNPFIISKKTLVEPLGFSICKIMSSAETI